MALMVDESAEGVLHAGVAVVRDAARGQHFFERMKRFSAQWATSSRLSRFMPVISVYSVKQPPLIRSRRRPILHLVPTKLVSSLVGSQRQ